MDWTQIIITAITVLIGGGGLVTLFTIQDKKNEAFLNNVAKLIDQWQKMAEDRKTRAEELKRDYCQLIGDYTAIHIQEGSNSWKLVGDFYEQFSLYDFSLQSISSNNLNVI